MASSAKESEATRSLRLLIVDDNQDAADSLMVLLRMWGHQTRAAYDGASALEAIQNFQPDCVLLDISMPGMDGYEVARTVRRRPETAHVRLVALSAYSSQDHVRLAKEAGFDDCFVKPADLNGLSRLLTILTGSAPSGDHRRAMP